MAYMVSTRRVFIHTTYPAYINCEAHTTVAYLFEALTLNLALGNPDDRDGSVVQDTEQRQAPAHPDGIAVSRAILMDVSSSLCFRSTIIHGFCTPFAPS